jgi:hypothetical protein
LFCVWVLGMKAKLGTLAFCSFLFLVYAFSPPSLGTPGLFPFVLPSVLFSGLSLSTPYLFPYLFFFVPVLWEETRKTVWHSGSSSVLVFYRSWLFLPLFNPIPPSRVGCDSKVKYVVTLGRCSLLSKYISYHTKKNKFITYLEALRGLRPRKTVSIPVIDAVSITSLKKSVIALGRIFQSFPR